MASNSNSFVLVTGVSGFLGAHVVNQLVKSGQRVRGTVRSGRLALSQSTFDTVYGAGKIEVVAIEDLVFADFTSALKDITAIIHVASPLVGRVDAETTLNGAVEGTLRIIRQGQEAGVKNFSIVSSLAALADVPALTPGVILTDKDWNPTTREQALEPSRSAMFVYSASKVLAEKEVWKFAEAHPDINITTLNPPFFVGPNAPGHHVVPGETAPLSTSLILYNILFPDSKQQSLIGFVDVRDVAAGLIAGINTPGRNRIPFSGEWFELKDAVAYLASVRPELKPRLATIVPTGQTQSLIDVTKAADVLGLKPRPWRETVLETIDYLIHLEKDWAAKGVDIDSRLKQNEWRA